MLATRNQHGNLLLEMRFERGGSPDAGVQQVTGTRSVRGDTVQVSERKGRVGGAQ